MARAKTKKKVAAAPALSDGEARLAAKYFTTSNLGQPIPAQPTSVGQIERAYRDCVNAHACDGIDITEEFQDWLMTFRAGESFSLARWTGIRASVTDLAAVQS